MFTATQSTRGINVSKCDVFMTLDYDYILRVQRFWHNDKLYLNNELSHEYTFNYTTNEFEHQLISTYNERMVLKLTHNEWNIILSCCGYPKLPEIKNGICTLCDQYVGPIIHNECALNIRTEIFLSTVYGGNLTCCFINFLRELLERDTMKKCPLHCADSFCTQLCGGSIIDEHTFYRANVILIIKNTTRADFFQFMAYDPNYIRHLYLNPDCLILNDDKYFDMYRLSMMTYLADQLELYYKPHNM